MGDDNLKVPQGDPDAGGHHLFFTGFHSSEVSPVDLHPFLNSFALSGSSARGALVFMRTPNKTG